MFKRIIFILLLMLSIFVLYLILFIIIFHIYIPNKTYNKFGNDVVFFTDKAGAFSTSGSINPRIWCTKDFKDIPMNTIFTRAALKYFQLDWAEISPIYFGIVVNNKEFYSWSFKKMDYVLMDYPNGWDSLYHRIVRSDAKECADQLK